MSSSTAEIVECLRAAYDADAEQGHAAMVSLYADTIDLRHEPPIASDGPLPASLFRQLAALEVAAIDRALSDRSHKTEFAVEGDIVHVSTTTAGTLAGEGRIEVTTRTQLTFRNGRIVALRAVHDPEMQAKWGRILAAGEFELPPEIAKQFAGSGAA